MLMLPLNLRFEIKQVLRKKHIIAGTILGYVKEKQIAIAKYNIYLYEGRMKILQLDVEDGWQRRGIGSLMATMMKAIARGYDVERINLLADVLTTSWAFWQKMGFSFYRSPNYMEYFPQHLNKRAKIEVSG